MIEIKLAPKLEEVFVGEARYRVAKGGRGSSKSWGFADMALVYMLKYPGQPFLFARELQNSIKDSVHKLLSSRVEALGLSPFFEIGESFFRCKNGSYGIFKGLRTNSAEIKSLEGVKMAWVEEAQKVSKTSWELLIPTIRAPGSEIWATYNPDEEEDAVHQLFVVNEPPPRSKVVTINWNDNPWFPPELEEERRFMELNDPEAYDHVWNGNCKRFKGGAIYGKWMAEAKEQGRITKVPYNPAFPVITAWDLGYSDTLSIGFLQIVGREPRMIDYYENNLEAIDHYVSVIKAKPYRYDVHVLPHDAGHNSLRTGTTLVKQLAGMGMGIEGRDIITLPVDAVESGIELVRQLLPQLWIDEEKCKTFVKHMLNYQYEFDEERGIYKKRPLHNSASHCADMARYMATYLARKKAPLAQPKLPAMMMPTMNGWMG